MNRGKRRDSIFLVDIKGPATVSAGRLGTLSQKEQPQSVSKQTLITPQTGENKSLVAVTRIVLTSIGRSSNLRSKMALHQHQHRVHRSHAVVHSLHYAIVHRSSPIPSSLWGATMTMEMMVHHLTPLYSMMTLVTPSLTAHLQTPILHHHHR